MHRDIVGTCLLALGALGAIPGISENLDNSQAAERVEHRAQWTQIATEKHRYCKSPDGENEKDDIGYNADGAVTESGKDEIIRIITSKNQFTGFICQKKEKHQYDISKNL